MAPSLVPRFCIAVLFITVLLCAGEPWTQKPYTQWTPEEIDRVLRKSPWAREVTHVTFRTRERIDPTSVGAHNPGQATTVYTDAGPVVIRDPDVPVAPTVSTDSVRSSWGRSLVLWYSSVTIREAVVRLNLLRGSITEDQAKRLMSWKPKHHALMVSGEAALVLRGISDAQIMNSVSLWLKRTRQRIAPVLMQRGDSEILLYFPRELEGKPLISPEEDKAEFQCKAGIQFKVTFDLRKMARQGQPDL